MADEVIISNVGGTDGVASEVTLAKLLAAMEKMANSKGDFSGKTSAEVKKLADASAKAGDTIQTGTEARKKNTQSVQKATAATNAFARKLSGAMLGALGSAFSSINQLGKEFLKGSTEMSSFAQHIPLIGGHLATLTGIFDNSMAAFQATSSVGASFNNDITLMRKSAAEARMGLEAYTSFIVNNSDRLATFGGTVTQGAMRLNRVNKALGDERENLITMGFTYEEINEGLASYMELNRAGSRLQRRSVEDQAKSAAGYIKNLDKLAKLTGQDVKSMQDKMAAQSADVAFQMKLAKLRPEERDKVMAGLSEALAMGGETGALYFKQQFLGMPALTRETQLFQSTMGESAKVIGGMAKSAQDTSISFDQFNAGQVDRLTDFVAGAAASGERLESVLRAGAAGMDGPGQELANILQGMGKQFTDYQSMENGRLVFNKEAFRKDVQAAQEEQKKRADATKAVAAYQEAMSEMRLQFESSVIAPLMNAVAPALKEIMNMFKDFTQSEDFKKFTDMIGKKLGEFQTFIEKFIKALKQDPEKALKEYGGILLSKIGSVIGDVIKSAFSSIWDNMGILTKGIVVGIAGLLIAPTLIGSLVKGVSGMLGGLFKGVFSAFGLGGGGGGGGSKGSSGKGAGKGMGNAGKGLGSFLGNMGAGVMTGAAKGLAAFANPKILVGAGILGLSIGAIGAGIAGATWLLGKALPAFTEGLKGFAEIDGGNLLNVAGGIAAVGGALAAMGAGSVIGAVGNTIANIIDALPGKSPLEKFQDFAKIKMDGAQVKLNAEAFLAYANAMSQVPSISGSIVGAFKDGIIGLLGGEKDPIAPIKRFGETKLNQKQIIDNAYAVKAYGIAIKDFPQAPQASVLSAFKSGIADLLGGETDPMEPIRKFGELKLNTTGIETNAGAVKAYADAIKDFPQAPAASVLSSVKTGIAELLGGETDPMEPIRKFGELKLNTAGIVANADAIAAYSVAIKDFPEAPATSVLSSVKTGIATLLGGEKDPFAPLIRFSNLTLGPNIDANANSVKAFATAMAAMPQVDGKRSGGVIGAIKDWFGGEEEMPWDAVKSFGAADIDIDGVSNNAAAINAMSSSLNNFSAEKLDSQGIISYTSAIEDLVAQLKDLNKELSRDNNGRKAGTGTNAGDVVKQIGVAGAAGQGGGPELKQLNTIMQEIFTLLEEMRDLDIKVERNTKNLSGGLNIATGSVSADR